MSPRNQPFSRQSWLVDILFLGILFGIFYALFINGYALFTPDEGRYSEVAREMVASHDYITPRLDGVAFLDKPILYYWLQASAIRLFGIQEGALRFWPALFGVIGSIMAYVVGRALYTRRSAIISAVILATAPLYYGAAHYANLDLEVGVLISITLSFSLLALLTSCDKQRRRFFYAAYVFSGLAMLTKGMIGIVFPMLIIGSWIAILGRWTILKKMHIVTGFIIFTAIALPWYWQVQQANPEFLHFFFVTQQVSRFLTHGDFNNRTVAWFYAPVILAGIFPWSVFVIQALTQNIKTIWHDRQKHAAELFLLLWFFIIFAFFSIPKSKTVGYIIPVFMPLALMTGNYLDQALSETRSKSFVAGIKIFIALCLAGFIGCAATVTIHNPKFVFAGSEPYFVFAAAAFLLTGILTLYFLVKNALRSVIYCITALAALLLLTLMMSADIVNHRSIKPVALQLKSLVQPADEVVIYHRYYQDLPIYLERKVTIVADWNASDIEKSDNWQRELWYGMPFQDTKDWLIDDNAFWARWNSSKHLYVLMRKNEFNDFAARAKDSIRQINIGKDTVWVSNS